MLDVLDGETLYEGGFLATLGLQLERGERLRDGTRTVPDAEHAHEATSVTTLALQYGLLRNLQVGAAIPFVTQERVASTAASNLSGLGDLDLIAKWRFARWDAPGRALNLAIVGELSIPTGSDDARRNGARIEPDLQIGSGGLDPALGLAATYEPGRWRFNAAARHRWRTDSDGDDSRLGNEVVAELAAGNRFWLEPYPGPFMRADLVLRWYHEGEQQLGGVGLRSLSSRATAGVNFAFRPRPALDIQIGLEIPWWQKVDGPKIGDDWVVDLTFGYRF